MVLRFSIQVKVHVENVLLSNNIHGLCVCVGGWVVVCLGVNVCISI